MLSGMEIDLHDLIVCRSGREGVPNDLWARNGEESVEGVSVAALNLLWQTHADGCHLPHHLASNKGHLPPKMPDAHMPLGEASTPPAVRDDGAGAPARVVEQWCGHHDKTSDAELIPALDD